MIQPEVSIVIPVFNEASNLEPLLEEIQRAMAPGLWTWEIIFVDDGSVDETPSILARLATAEPRVRILRLARNSGQSAALVAGFQAARGGVLVTLDGDLQNDPADIPRVLAELEGCEVVSGVRARRQDSWVRRVSSRIANKVRSRVLHDAVTDVGCSLKAYRTDYLRRVPVFNGMHRFLPALLQMDGARVKEISVGHRPRLHGVPKYGIHNRLWRGIVDLLAVRWLRARWVDRRAAEEVTPSRSSVSTEPLPGLKCEPRQRAGRE